MTKGDYIDTAFADLDEYYPGSKRRRKAVVKKAPEVVPDASWDAKPFIKTLPNGKDVEMFTIGALAAALGRPVITIRAWTNEGYLPSAPYRMPSTKDKNGKVHQGRRLYSRAMIESVVSILSKNRLLDVKRIEWSVHRHLSDEIAEAWVTIRAEETQ